jgi:hypothetical protein
MSWNVLEMKTGRDCHIAKPHRAARAGSVKFRSGTAGALPHATISCLGAFGRRLFGLRGQIVVAGVRKTWTGAVICEFSDHQSESSIDLRPASTKVATISSISEASFLETRTDGEHRQADCYTNWHPRQVRHIAGRVGSYRQRSIDSKKCHRKCDKTEPLHQDVSTEPPHEDLLLIHANTLAVHIFRMCPRPYSSSIHPPLCDLFVEPDVLGARFGLHLAPEKLLVDVDNFRTPRAAT